MGLIETECLEKYMKEEIFENYRWVIYPIQNLGNIQKVLDQGQYRDYCMNGHGLHVWVVVPFFKIGFVLSYSQNESRLNVLDRHAILTFLC